MHLTRSHALKSPYRFLDGGGAMAEAIEAHDWSRTPLGPIETWPPVLRIAISTMVNSAFPKCLCWGDTLISIYNDAFIQILGRKHPCLGQPFEEIWREAWDTIGPMTARALAGDDDAAVMAHRAADGIGRRAEQSNPAREFANVGKPAGLAQDKSGIEPQCVRIFRMRQRFRNPLTETVFQQHLAQYLPVTLGMRADFRPVIHRKTGNHG